MPPSIGVFGDFLSHHILMKEVACMALESSSRKTWLRARRIELPLYSRIHDRPTFGVFVTWYMLFLKNS